MTDIDLTRTEKALIAAELKKVGEVAGIRDPRDLALVADEVRIDPSGFIYGVDRAVDNLKKDRPHLFKPATPAKKGMTVVEKPGAGAKTSASDMTPAETLAANKSSKVWREALSGNGRM